MIGPLVGMVHLRPLPGSPRYAGDMEAVIAGAVEDALILARAGFDALLVENFGDDPYFPDDVPAVTVAAMTRAVDAVRRSAGIPVGVNVLRNDGRAALAVAAAAEAGFIRVNVLSGIMVTDQGPITGRAAEIARLRAGLDVEVEVAADVMVKHAVPPPGLTLAAAARDTWERAGADALILSGPATGAPPSIADLAELRGAIPDAPLLVGSGADVGNVAALLRVADGVIVGTSLKAGGVTTAQVDADRAGRFVVAARGRQS